MRFRIVLLGCIASGLISSCSHQAEPEGTVDVPQWQDALPIAAPWLRDRLPPAIRGYARIPHPLGVLASPKGNALDTALRSEVNVTNVLAIQEALASDLLPEIAPLNETGIARLIAVLRSPIEIAAFGPPNPSVLIAMTLDVDSNAALEELLSGLTLDGGVAVSVALDAEGIGRVDGLPAPVFVRFDAETGQLLLQGAALATREMFAQVAGSLLPGTAHAMHDAESRIDESGQGWFGWVDVAGLLPMAQAFAPPDVTDFIDTAGLDAVRSLAFGLGVADGKGRMSVLVDVGENDPQRRLPRIANTFAATAAGEPRAAALISLPTADEFTRLESLYLGALPGEAREGWEDTKAAFTEATGIVIEQLLSAIGPELLLVADEAGDYVALRQRDPTQLQAIVAEVSTRLGAAPEPVTASGTTLSHWSIPSLYSTAAAQNEDLGEVSVIPSRIRNHYYWSDEGEYLYISTIPQPLIDRALIGADTSLLTWLDETQGVDFSSALLAATGSFDGVPRRLYHAYLGVMQSLADIAGAEIDVSSMPTARQLGLTGRGALGFAVDMGEPFVSIGLSFESNPGELLLGGSSLTAVAVAGIVAAIAIPAYQDYAIRGQVALGLAIGSATRGLVEDYYAANGRLPDAAAANEFSLLEPEPPVSSVRVEADTGLIVIDFVTDSAVPEGGEVYLQPVVNDDGTLTWTCSASLAQQYLPSACR
jgi:hypothetical protein